MWSVSKCCAYGGALLMCTSSAVWGQNVTGELEGWVVDGEGNALPEALVTTEGPRLQLPRTARSDARGYFRVVAVPSGSYTVRFRLIGRRPLALQQVAVALDQTSSLGSDTTRS